MAHPAIRFTTLANAANLVSNGHPQPESGEVFGGFASCEPSLSSYLRRGKAVRLGRMSST